ncbi:hypothetical protein [Nonomuraea sp. NPDC048916]|uniref:hypothetical protein n=1 Tax=Nonomuraea sp. NPDC048916 TaxID=3154232 RepID=UPI0033F3C1E8
MTYVLVASVPDSVAGTTLIDQIATDHPGIRKTWVDGSYRQHLVEHAATLGIDMEIVRRPPGTRGFTPVPRHWVAERILGWLMLHRRLVRDYETLPASSEALIHIAMIDNMSRRLTGESTPTWRNTLNPSQTELVGFKRPLKAAHSAPPGPTTRRSQHRSRQRSTRGTPAPASHKGLTGPLNTPAGL